MKILLTPRISAALPKGTRNMEAARKKAVASWLISTALIENSLPMVGMATIRDETMNGARKEPLAVIVNMDFLSVAAIEITLNVSNLMNKRLTSIKILALYLPMVAIYMLKIAK